MRWLTSALAWRCVVAWSGARVRYETRSVTKMMLQQPAAAFTAALAIGVGLNVLQNDATLGAPPLAGTGVAPGAWRSKREFVAAWRAASAPSLGAITGTKWRGTLAPLGVMAPVSRLTTHVLFPPRGAARQWLGKTFEREEPSDDGGATMTLRGRNRFARRTDGATDGACLDARPFAAAVSASRFDGKDALVLEYARSGDAIWGDALGMRDEIRAHKLGLF